MPTPPVASASSAVTPPPATKRAEDIAKSGDFYLIVGVLIGVLFLGALILWFVDRWRKDQDREDENPGLTLSNFRRMFEAGEITQAEYDKILTRMAPKIKGGPSQPPASPPPPAAPPSLPKSE